MWFLRFFIFFRILIIIVNMGRVFFLEKDIYYDGIEFSFLV